MRTYSELKSALLKKGYKWFEKPMSLNFIWERTSYNATNVFDDWLHIAYLDHEGKERVIRIAATTKPGVKGSLDSPVTVQGITGTAIIKEGQYLSTWKFKDTFKEFSKYPYFRQIKGIDYWRDGNKNRLIDKINFQAQKIFGTHWHKMSNVGTYGSGLVNNWSLGCMGCPEPVWKTILPIVRDSVKLYGDVFSGTIICSEDLMQRD